LAGTTDQNMCPSHVFKVYEIVTQVVQEVSLHCRTVSFHDFITITMVKLHNAPVHVYQHCVHVHTHHITCALTSYD